LTRRLVDVSQDVIVQEEDCGTLRGLVATAIKNNEEVVESLGERILGRTAVHSVYNPLTGKLIVSSGQEITEEIAAVIEDSPIEQVEIRSVLTCELKKGVCAKCYGRNLATGRMVQRGEAIGVIAAQSIGEPGTQLTLRTFHVGGTASNIAAESSVVARYEGIAEIEELRTVEKIDETGKSVDIVIGRLAEMRIVDKNTGIALTTHNIPYGAKLYVKNGGTVKKGDLICEWDPYNAVIVTELTGQISFENIIEGVTFKEERTSRARHRQTTRGIGPGNRAGRWHAARIGRPAARPGAGGRDHLYRQRKTPRPVSPGPRSSRGRAGELSAQRQDPHPGR
jgi:DNA-directed RNA polymerase subunit beta'